MYLCSLANIQWILERIVDQPKFFAEHLLGNRAAIYSYSFSCTDQMGRTEKQLYISVRQKGHICKYFTKNDTIFNIHTLCTLHIHIYVIHIKIFYLWPEKSSFIIMRSENRLCQCTYWAFSLCAGYVNNIQSLKVAKLKWIYSNVCFSSECFLSRTCGLLMASNQIPMRIPKFFVITFIVFTSRQSKKYYLQ